MKIPVTLFSFLLQDCNHYSLFRAWLQENAIPLNLDFNCKEDAQSMSECDVMMMDENCTHSSDVWLFCTLNFTGNIDQNTNHRFLPKHSVFQ